PFVIVAGKNQRFLFLLHALGGAGGRLVVVLGGVARLEIVIDALDENTVLGGDLVLHLQVGGERLGVVVRAPAVDRVVMAVDGKSGVVAVPVGGAALEAVAVAEVFAERNYAESVAFEKAGVFLLRDVLGGRTAADRLEEVGQKELAGPGRFVAQVDLARV